MYCYMIFVLRGGDERVDFHLRLDLFDQLNDLYPYFEWAGLMLEMGGTHRPKWVWLIRMCLF